MRILRSLTGWLLLLSAAEMLAAPESQNAVNRPTVILIVTDDPASVARDSSLQESANDVLLGRFDNRRRTNHPQESRR